MKKFNLFIKKIFGDRIKKVLVFFLFPFRNQFILFNVFDRVKKKRVNINYWNEANNLGDLLSPLIVEYMLNKKNISMDKKVNKTFHLYAVGSVLTAGIQDATVWGSGVLNSKLLYRLNKRKLDIRLVRGPITGLILEDYGYRNPFVYGDPALLMPKIYNPNEVTKKAKYGLVLHKDYNISTENRDDTLYIDINTDDYRGFIDNILSVDVVISSSLHGIILAEAYGIPAVLLKPQKDYLKYYDYYYSTGRFDFPIASSIEEAKTIKPVTLPDLKEITNNIEKTFPYDIYL